MPSAPALFRARATSRQEANRQYDGRRRESKPWRAWYKLPVWRSIRALQLAEYPLCARCLAEGVTEPATVVHHVEAHKGDWRRFIDGPFESLCESHHNREAQAEEARR